MKITCTKCGEEMVVKAAAIQESVITSTLETKNGCLTATTLGEHVNAMAGVLESVADSLGGKVSVGINNMWKEGDKYSIEFLVLETKEQS